MASRALFMSHTLWKGRVTSEHVELLGRSPFQTEQSKDETGSRFYFAYLPVTPESESRETRGNEETAASSPQVAHLSSCANNPSERARERERAETARDDYWLISEGEGGRRVHVTLATIWSRCSGLLCSVHYLDIWSPGYRWLYSSI